MQGAFMEKLEEVLWGTPTLSLSCYDTCGGVQESCSTNSTTWKNVSANLLATLDFKHRILCSIRLVYILCTYPSFASLPLSLSPCPRARSLSLSV
eukprot:3719757-Rhodomonas_salina.1